MTFHFPFENTYARLPDRFYARVAPTPVAAPKLIRLNTDLALQLRLDPVIAGNERRINGTHQRATRAHILSALG